jgi:hypothetical protein
MDAQRIRCPIPVHGVTCGREELLEKRKAVGVRLGGRHPATHHECGEHKFHTEKNSDVWWYLCTCLQENE